MKLNSYKTSGYKGKYGWRNMLPYRRKINRTKTKHEVKLNNIQLPIPSISLQQFLTITGVCFVVGTFFMSYSVFNWVKEDIDYRNTVRHQVQYSIERNLLPYQSKVNAMNLKLLSVESYVNSFTVDPFKKRKRRKYRIGNTNRYEWR